MTPELSVVVLPVLGGPALGSLLVLLGGEAGLPAGTEVLVVGTGQGGGARWLPTAAPLPERRALGLRQARGAVVALLEDSVRPIAGWGTAALALHRHFVEAAAIGGTLLPAPLLAPAEAALLALDDGPFLRAGPVSEPADRLPASNVSFKREALAGDAPLEARLAALAPRVGAMRCESAMAAVCIGVDPERRTPRGRFQEGRRRAEQAPPGRRLARLAAPLRAAAEAGRGLRALERLGFAPGTRRSALPHLAWMSELASLGEWAGYLRQARDRR
jgi:hypothetical protein